MTSAKGEMEAVCLRDMALGSQILLYPKEAKPVSAVLQELGKPSGQNDNQQSKAKTAAAAAAAAAVVVVVVVVIVIVVATCPTRRRTAQRRYILGLMHGN